MSNSESGLRLPGVPLPFYREYANEYPPEEETPIEGQNYGEHQLFALRTRLEADREYANYALQAGTNITFRRFPTGKGMMVCLCVNYVDTNSRISTIIPDFLPNKVIKWLRTFPDYFMLLTDKYPLGVNTNLPQWWVREMLSKVNISSLIRQAFYPDDLTVEQRESRVIKPYTYFYHDGSLYVKLIDERNPRNRGDYTPTTPLKSGEPAFRRVLETYGDYEDYAERYHSIQAKLTEMLEEWYIRGTLVLDPVTDAVMIKKWKLVPVDGQTGIYTVSWNDGRFTFLDGVTPLLHRQHHSSVNRWDYRAVYFNLTDDPAVIHNVLQVITKTSKSIPVIIGNELMMKLDSYNDCVSYADAICEIREVSHGVIRKTLNAVKGSVAYYDALEHRVIYMHKVPDTTSFVVYSPRKTPKNKIRSPKKTPTQIMTGSPIGSPTFDLMMDPRLLGSPIGEAAY